MYLKRVCTGREKEKVRVNFYTKLKEIKDLFEGWALFFHLLIYFAVSVSYLYMVTRNTTLSFIIAIPTTLLCFDMFSIKNKKIKERQLLLSEIKKYTSDMTFFLSTGKNVLYSLE